MHGECPVIDIGWGIGWIWWQCVGWIFNENLMTMMTMDRFPQWEGEAAAPGDGTDPYWNTSKLHIIDLEYSIYKYSYIIIIVHRSIGTDPHWNTSKLHIIDLEYSIHKYSYVIILVHRSIGMDPYWNTSKLHILRYSIHKYSHVIIIVHRSIGLYKNYTKGCYGTILNTSKLHFLLYSIHKYLLFCNWTPFYFIAWTNPSVGECGSISKYSQYSIFKYSQTPFSPIILSFILNIL